MSFARTLTLFRLERTGRQLAARPERTIADIAYGCGFDSLATFYRAFRAAYAMTPMEMRAMRPSSGPANTVPLR
jgi:AraC-like DNA-binding protein